MHISPFLCHDKNRRKYKSNIMKNRQGYRMFYRVSQTLEEISLNEFRNEDFIAGYLKPEALEASYEMLDIPEQVLKECSMETLRYRSSVDIYSDYIFGILNLIDREDIYEPRDRIGIFLKKNLFLVIDIRDEDNSTTEIMKTALHRFQPENMTLEKLVYGFFEGILSLDNKMLEKRELRIEEMEEDIHDGDIDRAFISSILASKKEVTILRNYYEQLLEICELLIENENNLFSKDEIRYFKMTATKIERLRNHCLELKENVVQVREAYSSSLDYSINSVMKLFTVVTTIFQPLTLIAGWYGMNFTGMPELSWRYGYTMVIILSLGVIFFCLWLFRRKHLL